MSKDQKTIVQVIQDIEESRMFLPALQRKFVWNKQKIELFFDSIMRNYPIGVFLFWKLKKEKANNYVFYEFLRKFDERVPYNERKEGIFLSPEIIGILDGQQRLSSMYIGLQGTYTEKIKYMSSKKDDSYEETSLYLNLLSLPYFVNKNNEIEINEQKNFEFTFLTETKSKDLYLQKIKYINDDGDEDEKEEFMHWFKIKKVLKWNQDPDIDMIFKDIVDNTENVKVKKEIETKSRLIKKCLSTLHKRITQDEIISYFEIVKDDLEEILKIFQRVNSGGTQLTKADLLFSTIVATWENGRDEIEKLIKKINSKGEKFSFTNEYIMRCCLILSDLNISYKVISFKNENVEKIKKEWSNIEIAISSTVDLLTEFGFNENLLTSQNATLIIAYYIYKGGEINDNVKKEIKKYLVHALINNIYSFSQEQLLNVLRNAFRDKITIEKDKVEYSLKIKSFSFDELLKIELPSKKSLYVTDSDIEKFLTYKKSAASFFVLSLLYPTIKYKEVSFHQDHIHPSSKFTNINFKDNNIPESDWEEWINMKDMIPNLQIMEGKTNVIKNATDFLTWISELNDDQKKHFFNMNYIPTDISFDFSSFRSFFEKRKHMLKLELNNVFAINNKIQSPDESYILEDEEDGFKENGID